MSSAGALAIVTPSMARSTQRQWSQVTFLDDTSPWVREALTQLDRIKDLDDNWDGYGSPRIGQETLAFARKLIVSVGFESLSAPHVSPASGDALGFHWRVGNRELELTVHPDGKVEFLKVLDQDLERDDSMQAGVLAATHGAEVARMLTWLITG